MKRSTADIGHDDENGGFMPETARFDLIHEPWIPCRRRDGTYTELGIAPLLARSHELVGISGDVPTQAFAITRLLLAVLHGALRGPADRTEWQELWKADELPSDRIRSYLDDHADRFDLFHPQTPFYQVAGLRTAKDETSDLSKLISDVPNGARVFSVRQGELALSYAEAARWLVHVQTFDPSGIKSGAVGDRRVKNGKGYPIGVAWSGLLGGLLLEGATLKDTLLLNLLTSDFDEYPRDPAIDLPAWERDQLGPDVEDPEGRASTGPVDLHTWQSRRVRLVAADGQVTSVLIANGDKLTPQNMQRHEPFTAWRRSETQEKKAGVSGMVYMPREHDPERAIWRGLQSLLPAHSSRQRAEAGAKYIAPGILDWLGYLSRRRAVPPDLLVQVRAIGMVYGSNVSVTDDIVHDTLALRAILAEQDAVQLSKVVVSCVDAAESAANAVGGLAGDLAAAAGGDGAGPRNRTRERVYADLEPVFRAWLRTVGPESDPTDLQVDWHRQVLSVVRGTGYELLENIPPGCWEGRLVRGRVLTAAHAEDQYWKSLRAAVPYAFLESTTDSTTDSPDAA